MKMGERLKELRQRCKLNQTDFGAKIGVKQAAIGLWENNQRAISDSAILLICSKFNVNENWLRTGEGEMFVQISRDEEIAAFVGNVLNGETDTFKRRLVSLLSRLDETDWEVLEKMAGKIKKD